MLIYWIETWTSLNVLNIASFLKIRWFSKNFHNSVALTTNYFHNNYNNSTPCIVSEITSIHFIIRHQEWGFLYCYIVRNIKVVLNYIIIMRERCVKPINWTISHCLQGEIRTNTLHAAEQICVALFKLLKSHILSTDNCYNPTIKRLNDCFQRDISWRCAIYYLRSNKKESLNENRINCMHLKHSRLESGLCWT